MHKEQQSKKELRREMKLILANLDPRWIKKAHTEVCSRLTELVSSLPLIHGGPRHIFAWIPCFDGEVDLVEFIGTMLRDSIVYLPRLSAQAEMQFVKISDDWGAHLSPGPRGILQPTEGYGELLEEAPVGDIFVITPGLAFDQQGQRLGRGAGHYDNFLGKIGLTEAIKIGVCWSVQVVPVVPTDPHDVRMDWLCYERGVLKTEAAAQ